MRRLAIGIGALIFASMPPGVFAAPSPESKPDPRAWPATYTTADMSLEQLTQKAEAAESQALLLSTARLTYAIHTQGLDGTEEDVFRGDDYRSIFTLGPLHSEEGRRRGREWAQDANGDTRVFRGYHQQFDADEFAVQADDPATIRLAGKIASPCACYVVTVGPKEKPRQRRFYDASFHLTRIEYQGLGRLIVETLEDFRTVSGVTFPWRVTVSDGRPVNDDSYVVTSMGVGGQVDEAAMHVPDSHSHLSFPPGVDRVRLPVRFDHGRIIVRVTIGGRGLDFQLDSGAAGILIDRDVAASLHLASFGHRASETAGPYTSSTVIVPHADVGDVSLDNMALTAAPFHYDADFDTEVVGLLGYDFIAGCVVRVDYAKGIVEAIRPGSYALPNNAVILDAALDDAVPAVTMVVNGVVGEHFILDTGSDDTIIFPEFADVHAAAVQDNSKFQLVSRYSSLIVGEGVGGLLAMHAVDIRDLVFGNVHFADALTLVLYHNQKSFEGEDTDGIVGSNLLSAFAVSFDYANERVILEPGPTIKARPLSTAPAR